MWILKSLVMKRGSVAKATDSKNYANSEIKAVAVTGCVAEYGGL